MNRKSNFKIGCFHGKLIPKKLHCEAKLRNDLFMIGMLSLEIKKCKIMIRLVAHEMPIGIKKRDTCVDLFGYDESFKPYIIELKISKSNEKIESIIKQVNSYSDVFCKIKNDIKKEIIEKYFYKDFKFPNELGKIILAEREFFKKIPLPEFNDCNIYICSISRVRSNKSLLERFGSKGVVSLQIRNMKR